MNWVKKRFRRCQDFGSPGAVFIPAKLSDNPTIDRRRNTPRAWMGTDPADPPNKSSTAIGNAVEPGAGSNAIGSATIPRHGHGPTGPSAPTAFRRTANRFRDRLPSTVDPAGTIKGRRPAHGPGTLPCISHLGLMGKANCSGSGLRGDPRRGGREDPRPGSAREGTACHQGPERCYFPPQAGWKKKRAVAPGSASGTTTPVHETSSVLPPKGDKLQSASRGL